MLNILNEKQKELKKTIKDKWINNLTAKVDKDKIIKGVKLLYSISKLKEPKVIILKSPYASQLGANYLKFLLKNKVEQEVKWEVEQEVEQEVRQEVEREVEWEVKWEVRREVKQEVEREVRQEKLKFYNFGYFLSSWYYDWFSYYDFFTQIKIINNYKFNILKEALESGIFETIQLNGYCIVSTSPEYVKKLNGKMHSINSPAIRWSDGYELYYIHGVKFGKELFKKLTQHKMSFEEILAIVDVDQRNQAMRFVGSKEREKFLKYIKAEIVDEYKKLTPKGKTIYYKLYKLPKGDIFSEDIYAMLYQCPSTGLENFSGVPECNTVAEAMSWKQSNDNFIMTPDEWKEMVELIDAA